VDEEVEEPAKAEQGRVIGFSLFEQAEVEGVGGGDGAGLAVE
jgi:hypothetical protein